MTIYTTDALPKGYYQPPTGISRFRGVYDSTAQTFAVTVRATVQFMQPNGKIAWTRLREGDFMNKLNAGINEVWNQKFWISKGRARFRPTIALEVVLPPVASHMMITVQSGVSPPEIASFISSSSKMSLFAAGLDVRDGNLILRLDEGTVLPYHELISPPTPETMGDHGSQVEVYSDSHTLATQSLKGSSSNGHISFPNGESARTSAIERQVREALSYMSTVVQKGQGRVPLEVTGYRNSGESRTISGERAHTVAQLVRADPRLRAELVSEVDGDNRYWGHRYAKIRPLPLARIMAKVDYRAAIHEFGHCIGLPDEYRLYPEMSVEGAHEAWATLCRTARIDTRPYPAKHDSIMSCGSKIYRCHYITILDCLKTISGDDGWMIEHGG